MVKRLTATLILVLTLPLANAEDSELLERFKAANAAYVEALEQYQVDKNESSISELLRSAGELLIIGEEIYLVDDPRMLALEAIYGNALVVSQEFKPAQEVLTRVLTGLRKVFGENSVETVPVIISLANAYGGSDNPSEQIRLYERALDIVLERYGEWSREYVGLKTAIADAALLYSGDPSIESFVETLSYLPLVRVAPAYPARALSLGLEGYVDVSFTVTTTGTVKDPIVLRSTNRAFEQAATRAALKFLYKPRIVDGAVVETPGVKVRITFALNR